MTRPTLHLVGLPTHAVCENGHRGITIVQVDGTCVVCGAKVSLK